MKHLLFQYPVSYAQILIVYRNYIVMINIYKSEMHFAIEVCFYV